VLKSTAVWCALAAIVGMIVAIVIGNFWRAPSGYRTIGRCFEKGTMLSSW
jgi:hypothetical protein